MKLVKNNRTICLKFSRYVASYIANITAQRQQFNHYDVIITFYKLMNNVFYKKTIIIVARRTDFWIINDMEKTLKLDEQSNCANYCVINCQVAPPKEQVEAAAAKEQQLQVAQVWIKMRKLNYFIHNPFVNSFWMSESSKLKMNVTYLH